MKNRYMHENNYHPNEDYSMGEDLVASKSGNLRPVNPNNSDISEDLIIDKSTGKMKYARD